MKQFTITKNDADQRLDKFLKKLLSGATRGFIYKMNRKGKIKVKSSPIASHAKPSPLTPLPKGEGDIKENKFRKRDIEYKLQVGDEVKIFLSDDDFEELTKQPPSNSPFEGGGQGQRKFNKKDIVYEDDDLLVINKNPGINVHPGDHKTKETNVIAQVQDYLGEKLNSLTFKPSLVHRIDRDTSGILLIGKTKNLLTRLVEDFKTPLNPPLAGGKKGIKKTYYAIVLGKLSRKKGTIKKNLLRIENAKNENKVQVSEDGQTAITHYKTIKEHILQTKDRPIIITELEIEIETGRMHQIRVHMASLGNPIIGDKIYGDKKLNSFFERNFGLKRQALHAHKIEFFHYGLEEKMKLKAKIKKDLKDFIEKIVKM